MHRRATGMIEKNKTFLMLKIFTPPNISFYEEHQKILNTEGYVWFCRFGKSNLRIDAITQDDNIIFIKESIRNGNHRYLLHISDITTLAPTTNYPLYYNDIKSEQSIWFKVTSIVKLDDNFESSFLTINDGPLSNVYRSMCNSFYIKSIKVNAK